MQPKAELKAYIKQELAKEKWYTLLVYSLTLFSGGASGGLLLITAYEKYHSYDAGAAFFLVLIAFICICLTVIVFMSGPKLSTFAYQDKALIVQEGVFQSVRKPNSNGVAYTCYYFNNGPIPRPPKHLRYEYNETDGTQYITAIIHQQRCFIPRLWKFAEQRIVAVKE